MRSSLTTSANASECDEKRSDSLAPMPRKPLDRKSTRLNSSHLGISYAVFCLKKKKIMARRHQAGPLPEHPYFARRRLHLSQTPYHPLADLPLRPNHPAVGRYVMHVAATYVGC